MNNSLFYFVVERLTLSMSANLRYCCEKSLYYCIYNISNILARSFFTAAWDLNSPICSLSLSYPFYILSFCWPFISLFWLFLICNHYFWFSGLLQQLQEGREQLEELWNQRQLRLDLCLQLRLFEHEVLEVRGSWRSLWTSF